jgi:hypothetical protein
MAQGAFIKRISTMDATLSKEELAAMWKAVDPKNVGSVEVNAIYALMTDRYGKDKTALKSTGVIDRV